MTTEEKTEDRGKDQAKAQLESVWDMIERLEHCQDCTDDDCTEGKDGGDYWEDSEGYHDEDSANQAIQEDPLEVSTRSGWASPGENNEPTEYLILLCTGGPAVRITGSLDQYQQPDSAVLEYQDWFTGWTTYPTGAEDDRVLTRYAQCFYFGG